MESSHPWTFARTTNTICFPNDFGKGSCLVSITVRILRDGSFMLSYTHEYKGGTVNEVRECHPLYLKSIKDEDEDMMNGVIVSANLITYHMIQCLMCDNTNKGLYDTGSRPYNHYCGEVMRALTELEF